MANRTIVASAPHVHGPQSTTRLMGDVIIALLPALAVSTYVYGWGVLAITAVSIGCCVLFESLIQKFLVKGKQTVTNLSAVVTGLLLAMNMPANIPLWIVVVGALVAIGVAKMPFGGLGKNPFNPAIVARVFLLIAYPVQMTSFALPSTKGFADVYSGATPLAAAKAGLLNFAEFDMLGMFTGNMAGSFGEVATLALLLGGAYLLIRRVITWHIPVAYSCGCTWYYGGICNNLWRIFVHYATPCIELCIVPLVGWRCSVGCDVYGNRLCYLANDNQRYGYLRYRHRCFDYDYSFVGRIS